MKITDHAGSVSFEVIPSDMLADRIKQVREAYAEANKSYKKEKSGEKPKKPRIQLVRRFKDAKQAEVFANELRMKEMNKEQEKKKR